MLIDTARSSSRHSPSEVVLIYSCSIVVRMPYWIARSSRYRVICSISLISTSDMMIYSSDSSHRLDQARTRSLPSNESPSRMRLWGYSITSHSSVRSHKHGTSWRHSTESQLSGDIRAISDSDLPIPPTWLIYSPIGSSMLVLLDIAISLLAKMDSRTTSATLT